MVKIRRDTNIVQPNKYYIWTWRPKKFWNRPGVMANYKKHYCAQPFHTRYHAKKTAVIKFGVDALKDIHIISGRALIKKGITHFPTKHWKLRVFIKGSPRGMPPWIIPPEFRFDKHRRRYFAVLLNRKARLGRTKFNEFYAFALYGYTESLDKAYLAKQRRKVGVEILRSLQKTGDI